MSNTLSARRWLAALAILLAALLLMAECDDSGPWDRPERSISRIR